MKTTHHVSLIAGIVALFSIAQAFAEEPTISQPTEEVHPFTLTALAGVTFYTRVDQNLKYQGTSLSDTKGTGTASPAIGLEALYRLPTLPLSFGLLGEWNQFKQDLPDDHPDTEFGIYALAKVHKTIDRFDIWAGIGLGLMNLSMGSGSTTASGYLISTPDTSYHEFAFTPRFGFDYSLTNDFTLGLQAAYYSYGGTADLDVTQISNSAHLRFQDDFSRTWWTAQGRIGFRF